MGTEAGPKQDPFTSPQASCGRRGGPDDRLDTITKATATGTQAEKGKAPRTGGGCGNRPPGIVGSYMWTMSRGR